MSAHHPSPRRKKPYSRESISRAFMHHELRGVVRNVSPPEAGGSQRRTQTKWRVTFHSGVELELSDREAYHVCVALAAGETSPERVTPSQLSADVDDGGGRREGWPS